MSQDSRVTAFVVLLRGVNVGGNNKVPMAALRSALSDDGFSDVRTYIQSGNVIVTAEAKATDASVARRVGDVIRSEFSVDVPTVAIDRGSLESVVKANPYVDESDATKVHALFLVDESPAEAKKRLADVVEKARAKKDSGEQTAVVGPVIYLHTPRGFGDSEVAKALSARRAGINVTARNWRTVLTLLEMLREAEANR
jgi:uncharacterized protein (DUF1697 family)